MDFAKPLCLLIGVEMPRQIEAERVTVPRASRSGGVSVCRMNGAGGAAPRGNRNALKHGEFTAEDARPEKTDQRPRPLARETLAAIE
jgi:uncharacterized protein YjcR